MQLFLAYWYSVQPRRFWHGAAPCSRFVAPCCPLPAPCCPILSFFFFFFRITNFKRDDMPKIVSFLRTFKFQGYSLGDNSYEDAR